MVQNFEVYNQVAEKTLKAIVIAIDNYDVVKELGYEAEEFSRNYPEMVPDLAYIWQQQQHEVMP